jgi:Rrf2 family protein
MHISTRGRYALRALLDVALHGANGPVSRSEISARQDISAEYIAQLFRSLAAAGLVRGVKGPGGGYILARSPDEIRVGDVIRAVEGPIATVACVLPNIRPRCERLDKCVTHLVWVELTASIASFLDSITLSELCQRARKLVEVDDSGAPSA